MARPNSIAISGASSGIGAALALHYAGPGVRLALLGRQSLSLARVAAECRAKGAAVSETVLDIRDIEGLREWIYRADDTHPLDLVIANAGIVALRSGTDPERLADVVAQSDINFRGTIATAHIAATRMHRRGSGHIALISSLNALFPVGDAPTYSATKAGIFAYAEGLRDWLADGGTSISVACPGFVRTKMASQYLAQRPFELSAEAAAKHIARGIERRRFLISFPPILVLGIRLSRLLPRRLVRLLIAPYRTT